MPRSVGQTGIFPQLHLLYTDLWHLAQQALHRPVGSHLGLPTKKDTTVKKPGQVLVTFCSEREDYQPVALTSILVIVLLPSADKCLAKGHGGTWWHSFEWSGDVGTAPGFADFRGEAYTVGFVSQFYLLCAGTL